MCFSGWSYAKMCRERFGAFLKWFCDYKLRYHQVRVIEFDDEDDLHQRVFSRWLHEQNERSKRYREGT